VLKNTGLLSIEKPRRGVFREGFWRSKPLPFLGNFFNLLGFLRKKSQKPPLNFLFHTKNILKPLPRKISGYVPGSNLLIYQLLQWVLCRYDKNLSIALATLQLSKILQSPLHRYSEGGVFGGLNTTLDRNFL